jgi:hypothetical protein
MRFTFAMVGLFLCGSTALADQMIESYTARLGPNDHFNSSGVRLTSPAVVIRQDRANFHKFGARDREDETDSYFQSAGNRDLLQRLLDRGRTTPSAYRRIVDGQPLIRVSVYRGGGGDYVTVEVLGD